MKLCTGKLTQLNYNSMWDIDWFDLGHKYFLSIITFCKSEAGLNSSFLIHSTKFSFAIGCQQIVLICGKPKHNKGIRERKS